ncbi:MAG: dienelactone hydrolase family protein [Alcaligenaceae bacterium]|nr:dienelactone hydrolase family protein [Alcaligenaceae bacterium]
MSFSPATGVASTVVHTPTDGLRHGMIDLPTFDGTIAAYHAAPAQGSNLPVILVVQEIFGLHEHIQDVCRRFAHQGYLAIAVQLYQRQGDASVYTDIPALIHDIVSRVPDTQVMADLDASVAWAARNGGDPERVGVTGFCWGGRITWLYAAHNPSCKAGVAWYGRLVQGHGPDHVRNPVDVAPELFAPVLGLYGALDTGIPVADCEAMRQKLAAGNAQAKVSEMVVYPDSGHAFYADYRPSYNAADAADAWERALAWFSRYLKG